MSWRWRSVIGELDVFVVDHGDWVAVATLSAIDFSDRCCFRAALYFVLKWINPPKIGTLTKNINLSYREKFYIFWLAL